MYVKTLAKLDHARKAIDELEETLKENNNSIKLLESQNNGKQEKI